MNSELIVAAVVAAAMVIAAAAGFLAARAIYRTHGGTRIVLVRRQVRRPKRATSAIGSPALPARLHGVRTAAPADNNGPAAAKPIAEASTIAKPPGAPAEPARRMAVPVASTRPQTPTSRVARFVKPAGTAVQAPPIEVPAFAGGQTDAAPIAVSDQRPVPVSQALDQDQDRGVESPMTALAEPRDSDAPVAAVTAGDWDRDAPARLSALEPPQHTIEVAGEEHELPDDAGPQILADLVHAGSNGRVADRTDGCDALPVAESAAEDRTPNLALETLEEPATAVFDVEEDQDDAGCQHASEPVPADAEDEDEFPATPSDVPAAIQAPVTALPATMDIEPAAAPPASAAAAVAEAAETAADEEWNTVMAAATAQPEAAPSEPPAAMASAAPPMKPMAPTHEQASTPAIASAQDCQQRRIAPPHARIAPPREAPEPGTQVEPMAQADRIVAAAAASKQRPPLHQDESRFLINRIAKVTARK